MRESERAEKQRERERYRAVIALANAKLEIQSLVLNEQSVQQSTEHGGDMAMLGVWLYKKTKQQCNAYLCLLAAKSGPNNLPKENQRSVICNH